MIFTITVSLLMLVMAATVPPQADDFPNDLERWYVTDPPEPYSKQFWAAHQDTEHEWAVKTVDDSIRVSIYKQKKEDLPRLPFKIDSTSSKDGLSGNRTAVKVNDGWIVGFDAGEFGAGLWWFSPDGKKCYRISNDHIIKFLTTDSGLIAIEGLQHGTISKGQVIRLSRNKEGHWFAEPFVKLEEAPHAVFKENSSTILVVTSNRLFRIDLISRRLDILLDKAFWSQLYPNSIAATPSGTIFLGMRHGIAKLQKKDGVYRPSWLLPSKKFANQAPVEGFK